MELNQDKIINSVPERILHSYVTAKLCQTVQTYWHRYRDLVSMPLRILGIARYRIDLEKASIAYS